VSIHPTKIAKSHKGFFKDEKALWDCFIFLGIGLFAL
jgi:hypothetical protein